MDQLPLRPNVCMLVVNHDGRLFLGERSDEPHHWQFPQGGVEEKYSLEDNVYRELEEELGVSKNLFRIIKQLKVIHEYEWSKPPSYSIGKWRGQRQSFWLVQFLGEDSDVNVLQGEPEFQSWRWATPDEVRILAAPVRLPGYEAALKEFEEWRV